MGCSYLYLQLHVYMGLTCIVANITGFNSSCKNLIAMNKIFSSAHTFQEWLYVINHGFNTISLQYIGFDGFRVDACNLFV
jgi:hypothetical protein